MAEKLVQQRVCSKQKLYEPLLRSFIESLVEANKPNKSTATKGLLINRSNWEFYGNFRGGLWDRESVI